MKPTLAIRKMYATYNDGKYNYLKSNGKWASLWAAEWRMKVYTFLTLRQIKKLERLHLKEQATEDLRLERLEEEVTADCREEEEK